MPAAQDKSLSLALSSRTLAAANIGGSLEFQMARRRYQYGTVFLRGMRKPIWVGQWRESVIGPDGQEQRVLRKEVLGTKKEFPTKRLAQRELELRLAPINSLNYRGLRSATFREFVEIWQKNALPNLKASTQPPIKSQIARWIIPYFGNYSMRDIGGSMIQCFLQNTGLSPKSKKNLVTTLRMMWNSAKGWRYVSHDVFTGVVLPEVDPVEPPHFSVEQVRAIVQAAKPPYNVVFWLVFETGIRRGEVCALNVGHVSIEDAMIVVKESRFGKHITATKSRRPRVFSLSTELTAALRPFVEKRAAEEPLFLTPLTVTKNGKRIGGKRLHPDNFVKRQLKPILKKLGLSGALHAFRHGNATMLDRMNVPMKVRQERLGHVEAATTMGYTHLVSADDRLVSKKLGEILMPNDAKLMSEEELEKMEVESIQ
jgi:integrase